LCEPDQPALKQADLLNESPLPKQSRAGRISLELAEAAEARRKFLVWLVAEHLGLSIHLTVPC
jgi:hypothetical protein